MEWLSKLVNVLKIPLKILLPAAWLFSGLMTLLPSEVLGKLSLLEWKNDNGFVFGLLFLITSCLIAIYVIYFAKEKISDVIFQATLNRKTIKRISKLDDTRLAIIISMYNSPGYTKVLNYCEPLVQALLSEQYIYGGGEQLVSMNMLTNQVPVKFTLQPYVYRALDYYKPKIEEEIRKLTKKVNGEKNPTKKEKLQEELSDSKDIYNAFYNGGY